MCIFRDEITHRFAVRCDSLARRPFKIHPRGVLDIAPVVSDFRVGFSLLAAVDRQYVAYYDAERNMTVTSRAYHSAAWTYQILPSKVGWDSHNSVTMGIDPDGHLHVSGNMYVDPLVYFRTAKSGVKAQTAPPTTIFLMPAAAI